MNTMEPLAFCAWLKARMKSSRRYVERRSGAPCFLYAALRVLKVVEDVWSVDREPLVFYTVLRMLKVVEVERYIRVSAPCVDRAERH
jgi:hypothetical protein